MTLKPQALLRLKKERPELVEFILEGKRKSAEFIRKNLKKSIPEDHINDAIETMASNIGLCLTREQLLDICELYPAAKAELVEYNVSNDTESTSILADAILDYVLGSCSPTYGDELSEEETKEFWKILQEEAGKIGIKAAD
jgi:DNA polymerase II small subunit/DNA polymerase delta subunit B